MEDLTATRNTTYPDGTAAFLIRILADHLAQRPTRPPEDTDWKELLRLAQMHQVSGIVYAQCKNHVPEEWQVGFKSKYSATLFYYANRIRDMSEVGAAFNEAEIPYCSVKGLDVARYYPAPALRTMGDCDVVVSACDTERAIEAMRRLGFQDKKEGHAWTCEKDGRIYELHNTLVSDGEFADDAQKAFFNDYMSYVHNNTLDWSFHYLFLIMHLRKHFLNSGAGLRQFFDLAVLTVRCPKLDWEWIARKAEELHLKKFLDTCCFLLEAWFGVRAPIDCEAVDGETADRITETVLRNGVFGFEDKENAGNHTKSRLARTDGARWRTRLAIVLENFFPPYGIMRTYPGCSYVEKRPYLLPAAWLHRFGILILRWDKESVGRVFQDAFTPSRTLDSRQEILNRIGIEWDNA